VILALKSPISFNYNSTISALQYQQFEVPGIIYQLLLSHDFLISRLQFYLRLSNSLVAFTNIIAQYPCIIPFVPVLFTVRGLEIVSAQSFIVLISTGPQLKFCARKEIMRTVADEEGSTDPRVSEFDEEVWI